jgi:DNA-3-methyladenine glycosylase II
MLLIFEKIIISIMDNERICLANDPVLVNVINKTEPFRFESTKNVFQDLLSCILEQQIHYRSSKRIFAKMLDKADITALTLDSFTKFEELAIPTVSFSMQKLETVGRIVEFFSTHNYTWQDMSDNEIRTVLGQIKGVGTWTIDMILIFTLERPNVFPVDDFQLKQAMRMIYAITEEKALKKQMLSIAESWGNQKSLAVLYIWSHWQFYKKVNKKTL